MRQSDHRHVRHGLSVLSVTVILCLLLSACFSTPKDTTNASAPRGGLDVVEEINPDGSLGKSKTFTGDGFTITLTDLFREQESETGFDAYYNSPFCGVMVLKEPFSLEEGLKDKTLTEYVESVIKNNGHDTQPQEKDGLVYYRYSNPIPDYDMSGYSYSYKGSDAFYIFQFMCLTSDADDLADTIHTFAKSVTVD